MTDEKFMSRIEAARLGKFKYFTGKPCRNGHINYRYTKTGNCVDCMNFHKLRYTRMLDERYKKVISVQYRIHADDKEILDTVVASLNKARGVSE